MLQKLRHEKILDQVRLKHAVKVKELAEQLDISESTIRRDITELDQQGKLKKVFGGAAVLDGGSPYRETDVAERSSINIEEKEKIAKYAASLIEDDDFVYIDAGTTTERMLKYIDNKNATYVTNGLVHASQLLKKGFDVCIIGGVLRPKSEAAVGSASLESVNGYNFTKCFMGANGVDLQRGFSTPYISEGALKTAVIKRSGISFILVDHTKFGRISSVTFAKIDEACIITDKVEDKAYHDKTMISIVE